MLKLSKTLFWDVNPRQLDERKHADFIIGRILQWGDIDDWKVIRKKYNLKKIKKVAANLSFADKKSRNFWNLIFGLNNNRLCTQKLSPRNRNSFLKR